MLCQHFFDSHVLRAEKWLWDVALGNCGHILCAVGGLGRVPLKPHIHGRHSGTPRRMPLRLRTVRRGSETRCSCLGLDACHTVCRSIQTAGWRHIGICMMGIRISIRL
jgi:hypothetical protein